MDNNLIYKITNSKEKLFKRMTPDYLNLSKAIVKSICGEFLKQI
jgi:hypothetical protein